MKSRDIKEKVQALRMFLCARCGIEADFRNSRNGVPHIVLQLPTEQYKRSIAYFGSTGVWRTFYPYPASRQERVDFHDEVELMRFLQERTSV